MIPTIPASRVKSRLVGIFGKSERTIKRRTVEMQEKGLILCFTGHPFPVWIWTVDDASEDGSELKITTNMFAYDCLDPVRPETEADGEIYRCDTKDLEEVVCFLDLFHRELGIDQKNLAGYREDAEAFINTGNMYLWKDEKGRSVARCCIFILQ